MASSCSFLIYGGNYSQKLIHHSTRHFMHTSRFHYQSVMKNNLNCKQTSSQSSMWERWTFRKSVPNSCLLEPKLHSYRNLQCFSGSAKDKDKQKPLKDGSNSHYDFMKILYATDKEQKDRKSTNTSKDEYYKQVWLRQDDGLENDSKAILSEKNYDESDEKSSTKEGDVLIPFPVNTFGTLKKGRERVASDFRDHNERLDKIFKDDVDEERDWRKNIPLSRNGRKGRPAYYYNKKIKTFIKQGKIKEAVAVLDDWMMVQDRVIPNKHTYITLMMCLAKRGYTLKTFQLYGQMKQLNLDPSDRVYSLLFNSCENCPKPDYGLSRANSLYHQMKDTGIMLDLPTVKSAMRAFAKCGDFAKAFQILDESDHPLDIDLFDALLIACISDKKAGFKRALQVWKLMGEHRIQPEGYTYNLLARCVRDSGVGDPSKFVSDLALPSGISHLNPKIDAKDVANIFMSSVAMHIDNQQFLPCNAKVREPHFNQENGNVSKQKVTMNLNSSSSSTPYTSNRNHLGDSVLLELEPLAIIDSMDRHEERNDVFYPATERKQNVRNSVKEENIFKAATYDNSDSNTIDFHEDLKHSRQMSLECVVDVELDGAKIDEETGTSLLLTTSNKYSPVPLSELETSSGRLSLLGGMESFILQMKKSGAHPDIKTFSLLLSSLPNDVESEEKMLKLMASLGVEVDIGFLNDVMVRRNLRKEFHAVKDILQLISPLKLTSNMRTYAALAMSCRMEEQGIKLLDDMKAANLEPTIVVMAPLFYASRLNFKYKLRLLKMTEDLNIKPDERFIKGLEKSIAIVKQKVVSAEKQGTPDRILSHSFQQSFREFLLFYRPWLKRTEIHMPRNAWSELEDLSMGSSNFSGTNNDN